ncbi:MAG: FAD-binding oxidoreductase [Candidatus Obscuribacter sp.]|nr:FAD-binding oxidoreductase [Candidatus Obscuribacter sp.]
MTVSLWMAENSGESSVRQALEFDVAIIGGGVMGASAAQYIAERNGKSTRPLKVVLIESGHIASGASGRNGGFVLRGIHTYYDTCIQKYGRDTARLIYQMGEQSQKLIRDFIESRAIDIEYDPCGSYILASSLEELEDLSRSAKAMQEDGFELSLCSEDPLDRGFYGAIHNPGDFGVNPVKFVRALLAASDCELLQNQAIASIEINNGSAAVSTTNYQINVPHVLMATNAYTAQLEPLLSDFIKPVRGQMMATAPLKKRLVDKLCYANYGFEYFRQLPCLRMLIGGSRQHFIDDEVGFEDVVTRPLQGVLEHYFKEHFGEAAGAQIQHRWSGVMAATADGLPLVGALPQQKVLHYLAGCNGHGLGYSMALSRLACDVMLDGADAGCFAAARALTGTKQQNRHLAKLSTGP